MMTRFEKEINGMLGEFWKKDAEKRVTQVRNEFEAGTITVDKNGVARNRIGRILMDDLAEVFEYANCCEWFSREATTNARNEDNAKTLQVYKTRCFGKSNEMMAEMRAAFGEGATVFDVLSGAKFEL